MYGMTILIFLLLLPFPIPGVQSIHSEGAVVKLPGTLEQIAYYAKYEFPSPEADFIFYINENLLFYSIPQLAEVNPWLWRSFKTRKQFQQMIRTRQAHIQYEKARTQVYRMQKAVNTHKALKAYLSKISRTPMGQVSLDLTTPRGYDTARQILKLMGVTLYSDREGNFHLQEVYTPGVFEFYHYYQMKYPALEELEKRLNKKRTFRFDPDECEVRIPWNYSFLCGVTGLDLGPGSFFEWLLKEKRLQLFLGILYRLSDREIDFISALEPHLGAWKKIYHSNALLKGIFVLSHALRVTDGRLQLPGGETAASFWHRVAGIHPYENPGRFLETIAATDKGKLNYLFVFSFFLPDNLRKAVFFNNNPGKVKTLLQRLSLSPGEKIGANGLTIPGLRDFGFVTLLYTLKTRGGRIHFPGGIDAWAEAVGAESKGLFGLLSQLLDSPGSRDKIQRFVSIYNKFFHRPELLTPEVIDTLYRHYGDYNVLVDFMETIPIREPQTVLHMVKWLQSFERSGLRGREKALLTGIFQSVLYLLANHARYAPDRFDYDQVLEELMRIPFSGEEAYDQLFTFFKNALDIDGNPANPSAINQDFMQFLLGGIEDKVVVFQNQLYVIKAPAELKKEISQVLKKQRACALSDLVKLNGFLRNVKENISWESRMGEMMLDIYNLLPHPADITARDKRAVPLAWSMSRESMLVSKFLEPYSAAKVLKMLNRLVKLKSSERSPQEMEETERLVKKIKERCLLSHLQHYLVTCAYAVTLKSAKPRIFLNHNFTRLHDFYPNGRRTAWNSSNIVHHLGEINCYHLRGGLSRLNITLGYPYSDYMWGRILRYFRPQTVPMLFNNLDLYPYPSISRAQEYVGLLVSLGKKMVEKAARDPQTPGLRRKVEEKLARVTAGYHYRNVMALLQGKRENHPLYFSELMRLGEFFYQESLGGRPRIAKNIGIQYKGEYKILTEPYKGFPDEGRGEPCVHPALSDSLLGQEMEKTGSIYYHSFGTLLPHRYRLFPQPLSHLFQSKWIGGEMINELKVKTAYISHMKKTPPELLGFLIFHHLHYVRRFFEIEYKNEYSRTYHTYDTYNYLHMNRICKQLKKQGVLRLK